MAWIDTHCHLDAPEFGPDQALARTARQLARARGVALCVLQAVGVFNFDAVRQLAARYGDAYALGIHPLCVPQADDGDLERLDAALTAHAADPRLVAVGEIGLDFFVPALTEPAMRQRQLHFLRQQLRLARKHGLPVILHTRRSVDQVLRQLREVGGGQGDWLGIAHAFSGSLQQAEAMLEQGLRLGFGGAATFDSARRLRQLVAQLPLSALVLETDAPDIAPQWLYVTAAARAAGQPQALNTPAELPRIGACLAAVRGMAAEELAQASTRNAVAALPRLAGLLAAQATIGPHLSADG